MIFEHDSYGPDVMIGNCPWPKTPEARNDVFNRTGRMIARFTYAHDLGIKTCLWHANAAAAVPKAVQDRLCAVGARTPRGRKWFAVCTKACSATSARRFRWITIGCGPTKAGPGTPKPGVVDSIMRDLRLAHEAINNVKAPFVLGTCGWVLGPPGEREAFDKLLPKSSPLSCINQSAAMLRWSRPLRRFAADRFGPFRGWRMIRP